MADPAPLRREYELMPPEVRGALVAAVVLAGVGAACAALLPSLGRGRSPRAQEAVRLPSRASEG